MASFLNSTKLSIFILSLATTIIFFNISVTRKEKPVMHTFYEKTTEGQDDVLVIWKDEWSKAGFDTRILTTDDAKKHPYFYDMKEMLQSVFDSSSYHTLCYYRWLAMAAVGGGWMSDYDTFPTNFPASQALDLPNGGNFTSFEVHVPSLMSANAEEWTRVALLLMDAFHRSNEKTDIKVLKTLRDEGKENIHFESIYSVQIGFVYKSPREVDCEKMKMGIAIHMSHSYNSRAFDKGLFPIDLNNLYGSAAKNRAKAIKIFLDDWRVQCKPINQWR